MILETDRLVLRPYEMSDADDVHAYGSDPEVCRYTDFGPNSWEDTQSFLTAATDPEHPETDFAIVLRETGRVVGGVGARPKGDGRYELGWVLRRDLWGQGLVSEAAQALVDHVLTLSGVSTLYARCRPENAASARIMEKLGMEFVRRIEDDQEVRGERVDSLLYEMAVDGAGPVPA
jgi:ribosomal-protein-alanine N-acetyltransferase